MGAGGRGVLLGGGHLLRIVRYRNMLDPSIDVDTSQFLTERLHAREISAETSGFVCICTV